MSKDLRIVIVVALWAVCTACNGCFGCKSPVDQSGSTLSKTCDQKLPVLDAQKLDVLFVVDNSSSIKEEQDGVAKEMTAFVDSLRVAGGVAQDLRVGVITSAVYLHTDVNGQNHNAFCNPPGDQHYCTQSGKLQPVPDVYPDGGIAIGTGSQRMIDSSDPDFVLKFSRLIQQGTSGSGQETPFEAMRLAFTDQLKTPVAQGGNGGFLRDGARLLIVVLTDEDDCSEKIRPSRVTVGDNPSTDYCGGSNANSLTSVAEYHDVIAGVKDSQGSLKDIIYTAIAPVSTVNKAAMPVVEGMAPPTLRNIDCPTSFGAGVRHRQMAEMFFSDLSNLDSICRDNYRDTLLNIANLAGVSQTLEISGVPDEHVLQLIITRSDNAQKLCTVDNGGLEWEQLDAGVGRVHFSSTCKRRRDDRDLKVDRLCIY
ncbi:MAG: VWA domain-containing protein [Archangiaceae bacterium]|nr:VWA domain-containing protein [Archangiaceae bacterium]